MKNKFNWQLMWAFVLIGYGFYCIVNAASLRELSQMAADVALGQGSVFVLWGLRELFSGLNNERRKNGN